MAIPTTTQWDPRNLSHRYTVSFFRNSYGDEPTFIVATAERSNSELNYFNIAANGNAIEAQICAGLCVVYMENQGLAYHNGKTRSDCYSALVDHLSKGDGLVLYTADIVDHFYRFAGEF